MSPNQKKSIAVVVAFLTSLVVGFICGLAVAALASSPDVLACVGAGGAAFLAIFVASVAVIALFDFADDRRSRSAQVEGPTGQAAPGPNQPGAPTA